MENDEYKPSDAEEEYHFGEPEAPPASFAAASEGTKAAKASGSSKRRGFLAILLLLAIGFSVYKLADILFLSRARTQAPTTTTTTAVTTTLPAKPEALPMVPSSVPPVATTSPSPQPSEPPAQQHAATTTQTTIVATAPSKVNDQRLAALEQQLAANQNNMSKVTEQLSEMQTALNTLSNHVASINNTMQNFNTKVSQPRQSYAVRKERRCVRAVAARPVRQAPKPIYYVRAMIAGRAWLATSCGGTLTVNIGDVLPGYGIISVINPQAGLVATDSGAIIGYSPDDS